MVHTGEEYTLIHIAEWKGGLCFEGAGGRLADMAGKGI